MIRRTNCTHSRKASHLGDPKAEGWTEEADGAWSKTMPGRAGGPNLALTVILDPDPDDEETVGLGSPRSG